jgi:membrane-associated protein
VTDVVQQLVAMPPWAVLLAVFALPALEASSLLGLVLPGEVAVLRVVSWPSRGSSPWRP